MCLYNVQQKGNPARALPVLRKQHTSFLEWERDRVAERCPLKQARQEDETQKGAMGSAWCIREGTGYSAVLQTLPEIMPCSCTSGAGSCDTPVTKLPTSGWHSSHQHNSTFRSLRPAAELSTRASCLLWPQPAIASHARVGSQQSHPRSSLMTFAPWWSLRAAVVEQDLSSMEDSTSGTSLPGLPVPPHTAVPGGLLLFSPGKSAVFLLAMVLTNLYLLHGE